jgi:hypothetical protein
LLEIFGPDPVRHPVGIFDLASTVAMNARLGLCTKVVGNITPRLG